VAIDERSECSERSEIVDVALALPLPLTVAALAVGGVEDTLERLARDDVVLVTLALDDLIDEVIEAFELLRLLVDESVETFLGVAFFAALDAVDRIDAFDLLDAEDTERCTARPRLIVDSADVGVSLEGVTLRDRTEEVTLEATDRRPEARTGVEGTDWEGTDVRELRTL
jgi:hypothetical protein